MDYNGTEFARHIATSPYGVGPALCPKLIYGFQDVRSGSPPVVVEAVLNGDETRSRNCLMNTPMELDGIPEGFKFEYGKDCT